MRYSTPVRAVAAHAAAAALLSWTASAQSAATESTAEDPGFFSEWDSQFVLGLGVTDGNTQRRNLNLSTTSTRKNERTETTLKTGMYFTEDDGTETENRLMLGLRNDWLMPGKHWLYFVDARFDKDNFQGWEERMSVHVGVGYKVIEEEKFTLTARTGAGATKEWGSADNDIRTELLVLGVDGDWEITEKQKLVFGATFYPEIETIENFRAISYAGWSVLMDEEANMSLTVRMDYEHQSNAPATSRKDDFKLYAGLQFDF